MKQELTASAEAVLIEGERVEITIPTVYQYTLSELETSLAEATERLAKYDDAMNTTLAEQIARCTFEFEYSHGTKANIQEEIDKYTALIGKATTAGAVKPAPVVE